MIGIMSDNQTNLSVPSIVPSVVPYELSIEDINQRIQDELCRNTLDALSDEKMMDDYKKCKSVANQIQILEQVICKYVAPETVTKITEEYLSNLIPAGTKGVIRGNKFNQIVKTHITHLQLDSERFDVCFEKICAEHLTSEIPDWYIREKSSNKIILGMNQLDLWGGGHQTNRGAKYILNSKHNNEHSKLLCVISNEIRFKSKKNKAYRFFQTGFQNNTLCYVKKLKNIILAYFK